MRKLGMYRRPRLSALAIAVQAAALGLPAWAAPQGATVTAGQVGITQVAPGNLQVTASNGAIINWQRFSIGAGELTRFIQPSAQSAVLNRVTGAEASQLLGQLQANGRVFLINPNGIVVGSGARIDTNSFVASTLDIADADFLAGRMRFMAGTTAGDIRNEGLITAGPGGLVALIAPNIVNSGIIHAPDGQILLAAGRSIEIASTDRADVRFEVQAPTDSVVNLGKLIADNGAVSAFAATLRNAGEIRADRLVQGADGSVTLVASGDLTLAAGSVTRANGVTGGDLRVQSLSGTTRVAGQIEAKGADGAGGSVQVLGDRIALESGSLIDASGRLGGGQILVGGDYQGANGQVPNARRVSVAEGATLKVNANDQGDGGRVIVWADENTRFGGAIAARGGALGGNGGFAEVSGKQNLAFTGSADLRAPKGALGTLLLDPMDIVVAIGSGILPSVTDEFADFGNNVVTISPETLNALAANVELQASRHVFVKDVLTLSTPGAGLRILAGGATYANGSIYLESDIHTTGGSVTLRAQGIGNQGSINTNGGAVDILTTGDLAYSGAIRSAGGNVNLVSTGGGIVDAQVAAAGGSINVNALGSIDGGVFHTTGSGNVTIASSQGSIDSHDIIGNTVNLQAQGFISASVSATDRINAAITPPGRGGAASGGISLIQASVDAPGGSVGLSSLNGDLLRLGTVNAASLSIHATGGVAQADGGSLTVGSLDIHATGSADVGSARNPLYLVSVETLNGAAPVDVTMDLGVSAHLRLADTSKLNSLSMAGSVAALGGSTLTGGANVGAMSFGNDGGTLRVSASTMAGFGGDFSITARDGGVHVTSLNIQEGGASISATGGVRLDEVSVGRLSAGTWDPALSVQAGSCSYYAVNCESTSPITVGSISAVGGHVRLVTMDNGDVTANSITAGSLAVEAGGPQYYYYFGQTRNEINLASVNTSGAVSVTQYGHGNVTLGALDAGGAVNLQVGRVNPYDSSQRTTNTVTVNNTADGLRSGGFVINNAGTGDVTIHGGLNRSGAINVSAAEGDITALGQIAGQSSVVLNAITGAVDTGTVTSGGAVSLTGQDGIAFDSLRSNQSSITLRSSQGSVTSRLATETEATPEVWAATEVIVEALGGDIGTTSAANHFDVRSNFSRSISLSASGDIGSADNAVRVDTSRQVSVRSTGGQFHVEAADVIGTAGERTVATIELAASAAGVGNGNTSTFRSAGLDVTATSTGDALQVGELSTTQSLTRFAFDALGGGLVIGNIDFSGATGTRDLDLRAQGALQQVPGRDITAGNIVLQGDAGVRVGNVTASGTATYNGVDIASSAGNVTTGDLSGRNIRVSGGDLSLGAVTSTGTYRYIYGSNEQLTLDARGNLTTSGDVSSATSVTINAGGDVAVNSNSGGIVTGGMTSSYWEGTDTVAITAANATIGDISGHTLQLTVAGQAALGNLSAVSDVSFDGGAIAASSIGASGDLRITTTGAFDAGLMPMTANRAFISAGGDITIGDRAPLAANEVRLTTRAGSGGHIDAQLDRRTLNDSVTYTPTKLTIDADGRFNVVASNTQLTDLTVTAQFDKATTGGDSAVRTSTSYIGDVSATVQEFTLANSEGASINISSYAPLPLVNPLTPWNVRYSDVASTAPTGTVSLSAYHGQAGSLDVRFASDASLDVSAYMGAQLPLGIAGQPVDINLDTGGQLTLSAIQTNGGTLSARSRNADVLMNSIDVRGSDRSGNVTISSDAGSLIQQGFGYVQLGQTLDPSAVGGSVNLSAVNGSIIGTAGVANLLPMPSDPAPVWIENASSVSLRARNDLYVQANGAPLSALSIDTTVDGTGILSVVNSAGLATTPFDALSIVRDTAAGELVLSGISNANAPASFSLASSGGIRVDSSLTGLANLSLDARGGHLTVDATGAGAPRDITAAGGVSLSASGNIALRSGGAGEALGITAGGELHLNAGGNLDIVANGSHVDIASGAVGGSSHTITAGGDITVRGGTDTGAIARVRATSGDQSISGASLRIEAGSGAGAFAALEHAPTAGYGNQSLSLSGDLIVQGGNAINQGSGATALLAGHTQSFEGIGGRVLVAGGSAQDNTASITASAGQYIGRAYGDVTDSFTAQGGSGTGSFARVTAGGDQTIKAAHDEANPSVATGDIRALGGSGTNASAEIRSGGYQTIGQSYANSYYDKATHHIEVAGGAGDGAAASITTIGSSQTLAGGGTIKIIGGSGANATAVVGSTGSQSVGTGYTYNSDATDHVIVQGGSGSGTSASLVSGGTQTVAAGGSIIVAGGAQNAYAEIRSDSGQQTIGSDRGYWYTDGTDTVTVTGGAAGASARIVSVADTQTVQTTGDITLQGGAGAGSQAALVAGTGQTVSSYGNLRITGGADSGTNTSATGIVLQTSGMQSVSASGNIELTGGTGATDVGILHLGSTGTQTVVAQGDIKLAAPSSSTGTVSIDTGAGDQTVTSGGTLVLDNQGAAAVRIAATAGNQTIEAQSLNIALGGTQANAYAGLRTGNGFDQVIHLLGDGATRGTASAIIRNTNTGSGSLAGIQSGRALTLHASDDNYDSAGLVKIGDWGDTGRTDISAATTLDMVAGELVIQGGATADADAALNAVDGMNVSVLYGATTLQGGTSGSASIDPVVLNVVSNGSVNMVGGATIGATSTITAGTFNLAATGGSLILTSNAAQAAINAGIFNFVGPNTVSLNGGVITVTDSGSIIVGGQCLNCGTPNLVGNFTVLSYVPPVPGATTPPSTPGATPPQVTPAFVDYLSPVIHSVVSLSDAYGNSYELVKLEDGSVMVTGGRRNLCQ